ncbi:hypothetical protein Bpfe_013387 [Biomphalaria pfeifferi]|uniref:Uncharacterized protein n=1 Tax=Biomphalaria pfeifferi TaxID=112525 RepID=A0AAD8BP82_BIOPF|nr:hypothetical protein Bpfe_013387 [Biomphalaria pfeifferi]
MCNGKLWGHSQWNGLSDEVNSSVLYRQLCLNHCPGRVPRRPAFVQLQPWRQQVLHTTSVEQIAPPSVATNVIEAWSDSPHTEVSGCTSEILSFSSSDHNNHSDDQL